MLLDHEMVIPAASGGETHFSFGSIKLESSSVGIVAAAATEQKPRRGAEEFRIRPNR